MQLYRIRKFPSKLFILALAILIIALSPKVRLGLKNFTLGILTKPLTVLSGIQSRLVRAKSLSDEKLLLKERLAMASLELARMKEVSSENKRLNDLLGFKENSDYKGTIAKVVARDSTDWRSAIIINKGKKDGIEERMPAATAKGLIGSVAEVGPSTSKVMLITDPNSRVGVVHEISRESGVLVGFSQGMCKVIYLSLDSDIKKGERVLTAGFSAFFPKGLVVGRVSDVGVEKAKLYKYAIVDPVENMGKIEEVICIDAGK